MSSFSAAAAAAADAASLLAEEGRAGAATATGTGAVVAAAAALGRPVAAAVKDGLLVRRPVPQSLSHLQGVLRLAHGQELADQQQAAIELAAMIERSPLPALSFAPVAHALCRLLPSANRTTVFYAARAAKLLVLDDALRSQTLAVGLPGVLARCLRAWEEEVPCLRELLGAMQTLAHDKATVRALLPIAAAAKKQQQPGQQQIPSAEVEEGRREGEEHDAAVATPREEESALATVLALLEARDAEVRVTATATVANLCAYSDTLLLTHRPFLDGMRAQGLPALLRAVQSPERLLRCYAMAAVANAALHPLLAGRLRELEGVGVIRQVEAACDKETRGGTLGGTRVLECAEAALVRLGEEGKGKGKGKGKEEGGAGGVSAAASVLGLGARRWTFKWGTPPVLELALVDAGDKGRYGALGCLLVWIACFLLVLRPAFQSGGGSVVPGM